MTRRSQQRLVALVALVYLLTTGCTDRGDRGQEQLQAQVAAAETLCPVMWTWVKAVGGAFNDTSRSMGDIDDADRRRQHWMDTFDRIEELNNQLVVDLAEHRDDPILGPIIAEIERDVPASTNELDDIRELFVESPEVDNQRHQIRTSQVIVRIEKVIDLPKPELAGLDEAGTLLPAFRSVPSCQHSIKDVDDGSVRVND